MRRVSSYRRPHGPTVLYIATAPLPHDRVVAKFGITGGCIDTRLAEACRYTPFGHVKGFEWFNFIAFNHRNRALRLETCAKRVVRDHLIFMHPGEDPPPHGAVPCSAGASPSGEWTFHQSRRQALCNVHSCLLTAALQLQAESAEYGDGRDETWHRAEHDILDWVMTSGHTADNTDDVRWA